MQTVGHMANISFKDHSLSAQGNVPTKGTMQVNHNTFEKFTAYQR